MLREEKKKEVKERIIVTAVELFKQKGFEQVTVQEITQACGIAKGTFFNYFEKKEQVLLHVAGSYRELMEQLVRNNSDGNLKERLIGLFRDLAAVYRKRADILRPALIESIKAGPKSSDQASNFLIFEETLRGVIEQASANGTFRSRWDSKVSASILSAIFVQALIQSASFETEESMMHAIEQQVQAAWEGLSDE
ncbi:TetR/AcrR family transcriptional regulator [Paenibacillus soyae]|uniref:TetR/AcrR family transcriptional regulator n=1 Tax=Paenibacillus soyae TaxID=2969249 RepID=A0A9X2MP57_9BACL|nr:TetR/AcrR family transcriptional regulator [Paenibacillus soyae]MCR2803890.1 TetR/AcrR family transcriptional regulator [Paenibacillus soyae]